MNNFDYHMEYLRQALADQNPPPCDGCAFAHECTAPAICTPYQVYIENGVAVSPPRKLPTGEN